MSYTVYEGEDIIEELEKLNNSLYETKETSDNINNMLYGECCLSEDDRSEIETNMEDSIKDTFETLDNLISAIKNYSFDYYASGLKKQLVEKTTDTKNKLDKIKELLKLTDEKLSSAINEINKIDG